LHAFEGREKHNVAEGVEVEWCTKYGAVVKTEAIKSQGARFVAYGKRYEIIGRRFDDESGGYGSSECLGR
jgi:hypothetical protein